MTKWGKFLKGPFSPLMQPTPGPNFLSHEIPRLLKTFKNRFLKNHPGLIVDCFTVNTFAARHFTVLLQYFEFYLVEPEENFF